MLTTVFRLLAQVRRARAVHPRGVQATAELSGTTAPFPAHATVTVRLSRGAGTRPGWPDVLGLALRVPTESGDWDLLLSTTGTGRLTRFVPAFVRRWRHARLSTLAPYRYRGGLVWYLAVPGAGEPPERFTLHAAGTDARWRQVGELTLRMRDRTTEPVTFDPMLNRPEGMELAPRWFAALREQAYAGSRRGRQRS